MTEDMRFAFCIWKSAKANFRWQLLGWRTLIKSDKARPTEDAASEKERGLRAEKKILET